MSLFRRARMNQISYCSRLIKRLSRLPPLFAILRRVREYPIVRPALNAVVGYRRPFATFADAAAAIVGYEGGGHIDSRYIALTVRDAKNARPADYPALFHIQRLLPQIGTVFDLGGGIGNIFYCYSKYVDMPKSLSWSIFDLPETSRTGAKLAKERNEPRLRFAAQWGEADGVDLLITTAALHYFEKPLPAMISELRRKPRYILVNRAPLVEGPAFATVQDGIVYRLACFLYNRDDLIRGFESLGYELIDSWQIAEPEHFVIVPCYPDRSVTAYSGLFLRLDATLYAPARQGCADQSRTSLASA
jgi:putative methyltransferase (TIGR04325 family)